MNFLLIYFLFKNKLKTIAESKKGSIGSNEATNLGKTHSLPADKSMELIKSFCEEFWLDMQNGILSLGPRTFGELRPFLESLEGPEHCAICKELTVKVSRYYQPFTLFITLLFKTF